MIRGPIAHVKHAYMTAAVVRDFSIDRNELGAITLTGRVEDARPYLLAQRPLLFVLPAKRGAPPWPILTWAVSGDGRCYAQLAKLEDLGG